MNKNIMESKTMRTKILVIALILCAVVVAAWGLKTGITWASSIEEAKVISDEQGEPEPLATLETAAVRIDSDEAERLLADTRIFNISSMNNVPSKYELDEKQAAFIALQEIQRVFGVDHHKAILKIEYSNHVTGMLFGDNEVPESIREQFMEDFQEWISPPTWSVTVYLVDKEDYKDCETYLDFSYKLGLEFYKSGYDYQVLPTQIQCEFEALTGEFAYIFRDAPSESKAPYGVWNYVDEREGEPLYRNFLQQLHPELVIAALELVSANGYTEINGQKIPMYQSKITLSDGSGWLFKNANLCLVKYYPKGVPDTAIGQ
ncbi:MAG: hypothetical protein FWG40_04930 [Peptococcaceae bacterium]|nr:hypothetical protein [Peptococcaceae bacterium]